MSKVMVTIQGQNVPPTIEELRRRYQLSEDEIDGTFGVVEIDPTEHLYTVLVEESAAGKITPDEDWQVEGPYSNPRIEPFGPPESSAEITDTETDPAEGTGDAPEGDC